MKGKHTAWNSRSYISSVWPCFTLGGYKLYKLNLGIDCNIFVGESLRNSYKKYMDLKFDLENESKTHICMTFLFLYLYISIGIMYTKTYKGGRINFTLTFIFKVSSQGEVNYFGDLMIPDIEKVRIDTKIKSVSCIRAKLKKAIKSEFDLDFKGQPSRSGDSRS